MDSRERLQAKVEILSNTMRVSASGAEYGLVVMMDPTVKPGLMALALTVPEAEVADLLELLAEQFVSIAKQMRGRSSQNVH